MTDEEQNDLEETMAPPREGPDQSRRVLMAKAAGLLVVMAVIGVALLVVIWLLVTIVVSLISSL